jgi:hypothetical protein
MPAFIDVTGQKFGRLTALSVAPSKNGVRWHCRCDCGTSISVSRRDLSTSNTRSCGCLKLEMLAQRNTTHGLAYDGPYSTWKHMRKRCLFEGDPSYQWYGARGITICDEWLDFSKFHAWSMANGWRKGLTIERIDVNGHYEPTNCMWLPNELQSKNKRDNRPVIRSDGKRYALVADAARDMHCSTTQISAACSGKQKTCHGFGWRYLS